MTTFSPKAVPEHRQKAVTGLISALQADQRPILCGPFRSELGFEVLYWLPFLRRLKECVPHFDQRAVIVTRGGAAVLYRAVATQGYDLYALRSVTDVRRQNLADQIGTGLQKQMRETPWDEAVLHDAAQRVGITGTYHTVHPAWMYWALGPWWDDARGLTYLKSLTHYEPLAKPDLPVIDGWTLPPEFVAMKWYARHTFPYPDGDVSELVRQVTGIVQAQAPVVLLTAGTEYDDHADIPVTGSRVVRLPPVPPEQNLWLLAAVLARARAFVGTYGGVAQLALRMGVPSVSLWKTFGGTALAHRTVSTWVAKAYDVPWVTGSIADAGLWRQVVSVPTIPVAPPVAAPTGEGVSA